MARLADGAAHGELVVNAVLGAGAKESLETAGRANLAGKVVIDTSNAIDHGSGFPPSLFVANTDSLGEQLQRAFPEVKLVKCWNTMTAGLMCNPKSLAGGDHTIVLCGNDAGAKADVTTVLHEFGWTDVLDLGDITSARAMEASLIIWLRAVSVLGTPMFNTKFVR